MKKWHETFAANIGLRAAGVGLLAIGWSLAVQLHRMASAISVREATALMLLVAAAAFICASAGSMLFFVGPGLWEPVEVSERWRRLPHPDQAKPTRRQPDIANPVAINVELAYPR